MLSFCRASSRVRAVAVAASAVVLAAASAAHAVTMPFATFNRLAWAPDGSAFAVEMSTVALDISATSPVRIDTLLVDPLAGRVRCLSPQVESFALSPARDSLIFSDATGVYCMAATGGKARQLVWRQPGSDLGVRRVGFGADGRVLMWTNCLTELALGCNEQWVLDRATDAASLGGLRALQVEGARLPAQVGHMSDLVRLQISSRAPSPMDAGVEKAAFTRALSRALGIVTPPKGTPPAPTLLYTKQIPGTPRWIVSAGLYRKRPFVSRAAAVLYTPGTHAVQVLESSAQMVSCLVAENGVAWYSNSAGQLLRVTVPAGAAAATRTPVVPDAHVAWARTLPEAGQIELAEAFGLADPTRADELAATLTTNGYHAWPIADGAGKWGVAVGFYGAKADADSVAAYLVTQGYQSRVRALAPAQGRGVPGARIARYERAKATAGELAGAEAILELVSDADYAGCTVLVRRRGQDPVILFDGFGDHDPQPLPPAHVPR